MRRERDALDLIVRHGDGRADTIVAEPGQSLLEAVRTAGIADIGGFCGGICACVQCIVSVDQAWIDRVEPPGAGEAAMLGLCGRPRAGWRLACQIRMSRNLAGLIVHVVAF